MEDMLEEYIIQYADDTSIIIDYIDKEDLENKIETCYKKVKNYLDNHNLLLNLEKTEIILFDERNETSLYFGKNIQSVQSTKFLGFTINKNMLYQENIISLNKKITKSLPLIYNIRNILPNHIKRILYYNIIYSRIQYYAPFLQWNKNELDKLEKNHKKLIKILFNFKKRTPTEEFYKTTKLKPIESTIEHNIYRLAYKIKTNGISNKINMNFNKSKLREGRFQLCQTTIKFSYINEVTKLMNN